MDELPMTAEDIERAATEMMESAKPDKALGEKMLRLLMAESDRGCILVAVAIVDRALEDLIRLCMIDDTKAVDDLAGRGGPLESFGARIQLARCLGVLSESVCRDLDTIRRIRNHAAHHAEEVSFADMKIVDLTNNLAISSGFDLADFPPPKGYKIQPIRVKFTVSMGALQFFLTAWCSFLRKFERPNTTNWLKRPLLK